MAVENGESISVFVRVKKDRYAHLKRKAKKNPHNKHEFIATEIQALIDKDFEDAKQKSRD